MCCMPRPIWRQRSAHVHELLAPGGLLVLLEGTTPQRFGDLTVGLLDGWWAYADTERRSYALMARPQWLALLAQTGFDGAVAIPGDTVHPVLTQQAVFIAQRPVSSALRTPARWLIAPDNAGYADALATTLGAAGDTIEMLPRDADAAAQVLRRALSERQRWDGLLVFQAPRPAARRFEHDAGDVAGSRATGAQHAADTAQPDGRSARYGPRTVAGDTRCSGGAAARIRQPGSGHTVGSKPCDRHRTSGVAMPTRRPRSGQRSGHCGGRPDRRAALDVTR